MILLQIIIILNLKKEVEKLNVIIYFISKTHSLDDIITEIIYVLKTGISWRNLRLHINYNSIYYHFKRFVNNNIFIDAYNSILNSYLQKIKKINGIIIDSSFIQNKFGKVILNVINFLKIKNVLNYLLLLILLIFLFLYYLLMVIYMIPLFFDNYKDDILKNKNYIFKYFF